MKKINFFILFIAIALINCERDDICAETTATTPRLLIEFYDVFNPDDLKSVLRLTAYGENLPNPNPPVANVDETLLFNVNSTSVELPLIIGTEGEPTTVRFILEKFTNFRFDEDDTTDSNVDVIEISYIPEFLYVSRACGYKSIFNNLDVDPIDDTNNWISSIEVIETIETTVENENTIHVRIFH